MRQLQVAIFITLYLMACISDVHSADTAQASGNPPLPPGAEKTPHPPLEWNSKANPKPKFIDGGTEPSYNRVFVDPLGQVKQKPKDVDIRSEWVWLSHADGGLVPVLRNWVQFPPGSEPSGLSTQPLRSESGEWAYDFSPGDPSVMLQWKNEEGAKFESAWIANLEYPFVWQHESCTENGIEVSLLQPEEVVPASPPGMIVLSCEESAPGSNIRINIRLYGEYQFGNTLPKLPKPTKQRWTLSSQSVPGQHSPEMVQLGGFEVLSGTSTAAYPPVTQTLGIFQKTEPKEPMRRAWHGSVSAQGSSLSYIEGTTSGATRAKSNQWGATLKAGVDWSKPVAEGEAPSELNRWNFGGSAFGTLFSFAATQSGPVVSPGNEGTAGAPRFLGLNLRAGRRLTAWESPWDIRASAGLYYWSMLQASRDFGLDYLVGPQLVLSARRTLADARTFGGYIKVARTGAGFGLGLDQGRELAVGGDFQLNAPGSKNRILAVVDIAHTSLNVASIDRTISLTAVSLGVGFQF
jgi:hypothetical protein